jgi:peroxiredoxin
VELQSRVKELRDRGLGLAVISYDPREIHEAFSRQNGITFPLLSDKGSETIKRYGILNTVVEEALGPNRDDPAVKADVSRYIAGSGTVPPMMKGIAFPGTFILDRQGRVTSRFFEDFYVERSTVAGILKRLDGRDQPVPGTKVSTEHLDVSTYPSDAAVAPGNRFSLALDIRPKRGMHLYAPGASGYRIISLSIAEQPFVRMLPLRYPASEIYFFKPLNERVPVYQKPFTLVQEIILEGQPAAQAAFKGRDSLTLSGTLDYQACDDKLCFNPASIPLSWTVSMRPLVFQRPTVAR